MANQTQTPTMQLASLIDELGTLGDEHNVLLGNVTELKKDQIALYRSVVQVRDMMSKLAVVGQDIQELITHAQRAKGNQEQLLAQILQITQEAPQTEEVTEALNNLQQAVAQASNGPVQPLIYPKDIQIPAPTRGGKRHNKNKKGGYKYKRDTIKRSEIKSRRSHSKTKTTTRRKK